MSVCAPSTACSDSRGGGSHLNAGIGSFSYGNEVCAVIIILTCECEVLKTREATGDIVRLLLLLLSLYADTHMYIFMVS